MKILVLLTFCVVTVTAYDKYWLYKKQAFLKAVDSRTQTRSLRSCWLDTSGLCCKNMISDCRYYRRYNSSKPNKSRRLRGNYFYFNNKPFKPGNFWYSSCNVQCLCSSQPPSCSSSNTVVPVTHGPTTARVTAPPVTAGGTTATTATTTTTATTIGTGTTATTATTVTTVSTATTVSTTATTTTATTSVVTRFCPAGVTTQSNTTRILNGTPLTSCTTFPGVVSVVDPANGNTLCTGVVTSSTTVSVPNNCAQLMGTALELREPLSGTVIQTLPVIDTTTVPTGGAFTLTLATPLTATSCPGIACLFTTAMVNNIDLNSCVVVGAGFSDNAGTSAASYSFMNVTTLQPTTNCPSLISGSSQAILFDTTLTYNCFFGGGSSTCAGDPGAPMMCPLSTGEIAVIGQVENIPCAGTDIIGAFNLQGGTLRVLGSKVVSLGRGNRRTRERITSGVRRKSQKNKKKISDILRGKTKPRKVKLGVAPKKRGKKARRPGAPKIIRQRINKIYRGKVQKTPRVRIGTKKRIILGTRRTGNTRIRVGRKKANPKAIRRIYEG